MDGVKNGDFFGEGDVDSRADVKLDVVKLDYIASESMAWPDLFGGFDRIRAITYSSGIGFVYRLVEKFKNVEIIFGCEEVMSCNLQEIMAYQANLIERIRKTDSCSKTKMIERVETGDIRLFVARGRLSHEKLYLLDADDGRKRVILGSANMSFNAFRGRQRETICYLDSNQAYERFDEIYEDLKNNSVDKITQKAIAVGDAAENLDALPIAETIKAKKAVYIEPVKEIDEEVRFILDTRDLARRLKPSILIDNASRKTGRILISVDTIQKVRRQAVRDKEREKELRNEYPQLVIDSEQGVATLNGKTLDLNPDVDDVRNDVNLFIRYMNGYERFHGDSQGMQNRYYEFANWFFCSPLMAVMRDTALRYDQKTLPYPVFGLVYGQSKAGKTSFLETLLKMMIGQKTKIGAPDFTRTTIDGLRHSVQGAPIVVDDLTQNRFSQHAVETIKNDDFGLLERLLSYPAVVISANEDVKAVAPEVIRRTVICRVQAGLTNTEVMKSNVVRAVQQKIGTAFYREYLRRMLTKISDMMEQLKDDAPESECPDILKVSSEVLYGIFSAFADEMPSYVRKLSLEDYFSEKVTGKYAIQTIRTAWKSNPKAFVVDERAGTIRYETGVNWDADRLMKELPENLCAQRSRDSVIMKLEEAKEFFEIDFVPPSIFKRIFR